MRRCALILFGLALAMALPAIAMASWGNPGAGSGYSKAQALASGNAPTASVSGRNVTVSWTATSGTVPATAYTVKRYDLNGAAQSVASGCSGSVAGLSCTEQGVPGGQWRYSVTPINGNWRGAESSQGAAVTVASPSLTLTTTTAASLPAAFTGQITSFIGGQTVSFRLDNATTGTVLSGSINPSPVPTSGTSSVSVTLPAGTANGAHTIYAIGSAGDTAGIGVTVAAAVTTTISTSAWDGRDASAGTGAINQSDPSAFAGDLRSSPSGAFATTFSTSRYLQYAFNSPLAAEDSISSATFNLYFASAVGGETTCIYFDVRRASTGAVIGTHGSTGAPVACTTTSTFKATSTALPEVTTATVANDLRVRVYATSSGSHAVNIDLATVSGASSGMAFTLYEKNTVDSSTGTAGAAVPWVLFASDEVSYSSASNWATTFLSTRYMKLAFPAYVPAAAIVKSVSVRHSYRSVNNGAKVCYYLEVYSGATLLGTHGSATEPVSCNSSGTVWQTDTVALPEVTTAAAANSLSVNLYVNRSTAGKSRHDLAELEIAYSK